MNKYTFSDIFALQKFPLSEKIKIAKKVIIDTFKLGFAAEWIGENRPCYFDTADTGESEKEAYDGEI